MSAESDREYFARFTRSLDQYDALARQHTHYVLCTDPADYPVHRRAAAWAEAGREIRRIYHASKRTDPRGYFK